MQVERDMLRQRMINFEEKLKKDEPDNEKEHSLVKDKKNPPIVEGMLEQRFINFKEKLKDSESNNMQEHLLEKKYILAQKVPPLEEEEKKI